MPSPINGQPGAVKQRRLLNKLICNLVAYTGGELADIASKQRRSRDPNKPSKRRLLYRRAADLTDADLEVLVVTIGFDRLWRALDRHASPRLPLVAAE